ncbi:ATP-binding cassette subfamily C protein [Williamsia limnetica]|uniref:ATP-binding cassette subfamily C protein n=1 Tax=Williamsia limnetica TaxID=882452 RepID=A0A318RLL4_WILLI|nr:ABC transporter ATP-binding protein [Williamsia limnetica]PYE17929.1 ATP-binding cassette subfamily C protein [Williamsia limnetica]
MTLSQVRAPHTALPVATGAMTRRWLTTALRERRSALVRIAVASLIAGIAAVAPALALGVLVDEVSDDGRLSVLLPIAAVAAGAALLGGVAAGFSMYVIAALGSDLLAQLREAVVRTALRLPADTMEKSGRGDLLSRVSNDVAAVSKAVSTVLPTVVISAVLAAVSIIAMAGLDWRLGVAGAIAIPLYGLALHWYLPRSTPRYSAERRAVAERSQVLVERIVGARTLHAYGIEEREIARIDAASAAARDISIAAFTLFTRLVGRVNRAEFIGLASILVVGFILVEDGAVTVGATTAAALLFHRLFNPIGMILYSFADLQLAAAGLTRLVGVAQDDTAHATDSSVAGAVPADSALELRDVHFGYDPGHPVLRGVNLRIEPGTSVALVGPSGAGKSTLAAIAAGTYPPTSGSATVGGLDLHSLPYRTVRQHVVVLSQDVHVFAGTVTDDLQLAKPGADVGQIRTALAGVGALEWAEKLPQGLDTVVGEGGHELTDAQAQQLALARLMLIDPPIAVLDEATAEAGSLGARDLDRSAAAATAGRTTLIVAHRLSQAIACDRVVVMDRGVLVQQGTPSELLATPGPFAQLWTAWNIQGRDGDHA